MNKTVVVRFSEVASQAEDESVCRLIGAVDAKNFALLISTASLDANPRDSKLGSITRDIQESLSNSSSIFRHKTKGVLLSCSQAETLERNRYRLTFEDTDLDGILDGGHNTLAIGHYLLTHCIPEDQIGKIRLWSDFKEEWNKHSQEVIRCLSGNDASFGFLIPIEVLYPPKNGSLREFQDAILEISAARNNNNELSSELKANKEGLYDELRAALDPAIESQVEWRNDGGRIKASEMVALSLIPLSVVWPELIFDGKSPKEKTLNLVPIYSSKGQCIQIYTQIMCADDVARQKKGDMKEIVDLRIKSALSLMRDLPKLYDIIYAEFPTAYNLVPGKFGRITGVLSKEKAIEEGSSLRPFLSRYYRNEVAYNYSDGFIMPIVVALAELIQILGDQVSWKVPDPAEFIRQSLPMIAERFKTVIEMASYDPQKIGKNRGSYTIARDAFRVALAEAKA